MEIINNELRFKMEKTLSVIGHNLMVDCVHKCAFEKVRQRMDEESSTSCRFISNQLASSESEDFY